MTQNHWLNVGDWVSGRTVNDEIFIGFVESFENTNGSVKVTVTECDHTSLIHKRIVTFQNLIKKLPIFDIQEKGQLHNLIDIALMEKDRETFMQLTRRLQEMENSKDPVGAI
ncbi:IDEAL domain-containing protein [Bacillaceae bacterium SIJ1]|uniref:IDEAL domain-containing protein n=1 Tax=Litoribacterium kuwaitense TaxID=1398745 RepID=UPI0013EC7204|nr:IDEAL domain-containing protein [Litoribacterium kuwaitense]NGP43986.1 IDEAL domain-containing protein [Litoribacterium kuwaitense]